VLRRLAVAISYLPKRAPHPMKVPGLSLYVIQVGAGHTVGIRARQFGMMCECDQIADLLGDAANYGISLAVLDLSRSARARASRLKAASMLACGGWVLGLSAWHILIRRVTSVPTIGVVGTRAILANGVVAGRCFRYREGDSNMRSVSLCTRNDVLGNVAVLLAALGVFGTGLHGRISPLRQSCRHLRLRPRYISSAKPPPNSVITRKDTRLPGDFHSGGCMTAHACTGRPREVHPAGPCTIIPAIASRTSLLNVVVHSRAYRRLI
jgi:hypothetical protein